MEAYNNQEPQLSWMTDEEYYQYIEEIDRVAVWEKPARKIGIHTI